MLKQRVMEDLDSLLNDLQLTTHHDPPDDKSVTITLPAQSVHAQSASKDNKSLSSSTGSLGSNAYSSSNEAQPKYSTTVTVAQHKIGGDSSTPKQENIGSLKQHETHTIPKANSSSSSAIPSFDQSNLSSLTNNLSELDMLLQDLSSAQFMAEVDRRNAANNAYHGLSVGHVPVITGEMGRRIDSEAGEHTDGTTVDSLLYELESSIPGDGIGNVRVVNEKMTEDAHIAADQANSDKQPQVSIASDATRELDNLMSSLSDFKVVASTQDTPATAQQQQLNPANEQLPHAKPKSTTKHVGEPPYATPDKLYYKQQNRNVVASNGSDSTKQPDSCTGPTEKTGDVTDTTHHYQCQQQQYSSQSHSVTDATGETHTSSNAVLDQSHYHCDNAGITSSAVSRYHTTSMPDGGVSTAMTHQYQQSGSPLQQQLYTDTCDVVTSEAQQQAELGDTSNDNLDAMMGNLNTDMSRQGILTLPKGHCTACAKPIVGPVITALGSVWHPEHFTCAECHEELGVQNFFEREGMPYCEKDYHKLFSPRCAHCGGPIIDKCVTALSKNWHPEHFVCAHCSQPFGEGGFHEKDGNAYCRNDYFELFAPKCGRCCCSIMENFISALDRKWHPQCFSCMECNMPFGGGNFFEHDGMPYCETHYHALRGSLCAGCAQPITGRCITAMFKKFHPEHFLCAFCLRQLNKGTFKEQGDKPYCHDCFDKLFGCTKSVI